MLLLSLTSRWAVLLNWIGLCGGWVSWLISDGLDNYSLSLYAFSSSPRLTWTWSHAGEGFHGGSRQSLWRSRLGTHLKLPHSTDQSKLQGQPGLKGWGKGLHLWLGEGTETFLSSIPIALIMDRRLITLCYSSYHKLLGRMEEEEWYVLIVVGGVGRSLGKSSQRRKP